jgi:lipopolysaccharide/colanic/teichoic acid biosynthesis glycosyltransferase
MRVGADREGIGLTVGEDARVTDVGHTLRRYKLDELPQLFNVLAGEMSLVGPRPEDPRFVEMYTPEQRTVLELMPGITDPASIRYADESAVLGAADDAEREYVDRIMPEKIEMNLAYAGHASLWSDTQVIIRTARSLPG